MVVSTRFTEGNSGFVQKGGRGKFGEREFPVSDHIQRYEFFVDLVGLELAVVFN